ncbi:acetylornithine transaminase Ecym_2019 [Eremothecium cymbalariae DBVPG|uniref:Acetylornithine aminotransferase, mitochondrial n=1 Tax=Eremothecium cymbalariae (strain CBS 270.75 / DBVPG 7215 / KCTC 17166 / NRRL Y-17582) TaxID=931890 RepID=G8JNX8_ERECY|nr:Hypothetical protein Ecym_2019 [Eremothecium cymbalariae DBVPG\
MLQSRRFFRSSSSNLNSVGKMMGFEANIYAKPHDLILTRGANSILYDDINNKQYIDFTSGIAVASLGHANPKIAEVIQKQSTKLLHTSNLFNNIEGLQLCQSLIETTKQFGGQHDASAVYLCNSGTEANEAALKFAKKYGVQINPNKHGILAFEQSFHGRTMGSLSVTSNPKYRLQFGSGVPNTTFLDISDDLSTIESFISENASQFAALIVEPVQGEGGVLPLPAEKLISIKRVCVENDILVIYDEIQCGIGRTGKLWAHSYLPKEAHPDLFTTAKALGNGYPIGATIMNSKVNSVLKVGDHGCTYGGNPMASAIACSVLSTIANDQFLNEVGKKAQVFVTELRRLQNKYPVIRDVRGRGLFIGVEFQDNPAELIKVARKNGLLVVGASRNTIRIVPPLTVENSVIDAGLEILEKSIREIYL